MRSMIMAECSFVLDFKHIFPRQKGIYAKCLERRTKVFNPYNEGEYFVGRKGDYLAIRQDDLSDIYIIKNGIFQETYEEME